MIFIQRALNQRQQKKVLLREQALRDGWQEALSHTKDKSRFSCSSAYQRNLWRQTAKHTQACTVTATKRTTRSERRAAQHTDTQDEQAAMVHMSPIDLSSTRSSGALSALAAVDDATATIGSVPRKVAAGGPMKRRKRRAATGAAPAAAAETATGRDGDADALNAAAGVSSEEEKKEKNRNSVRRSYYRKIVRSRLCVCVRLPTYTTR